MPKLQNGIKGDSNPGSLDFESGFLPLSYQHSTQSGIHRRGKGPATGNDIVDDIVDDPSSTMVFNVAKIASARASSTISLTKSLRVAGP